MFDSEIFRPLYPNYKITVMPRGYLQLQIRSGQDFPYQIRWNKSKRWYALYQEFMGSWYMIMKCIDQQPLVARIILRHNKSCKIFNNKYPWSKL